MDLVIKYDRTKYLVPKPPPLPSVLPSRGFICLPKEMKPKNPSLYSLEQWKSINEEDIEIIADYLLSVLGNVCDNDYHFTYDLKQLHQQLVLWLYKNSSNKIKSVYNK